MKNERMRPTDEELYRRLRGGDKSALAELYERHEAALYRYTLCMSGSRSIAEETVQEVFLRLIAGAGRFEEQRGSLEAWLYGVARNLARRMDRGAGPQAVPEAASGDDLLGELLEDERTISLYRALDELPPRYREIVLLCDLEERSYEAAARLLQCPVGTVRSRLHRARLLLSARLAPLQNAGVVAGARG
jgi:RNA polymerase sigma-70 factor (ECF subfamily)